MRLSTIHWNYSHISGWLVATGPSERCMITESVQWPNLNPIGAQITHLPEPEGFVQLN
jgi:hypothetical protein